MKHAINNVLEDAHWLVTVGGEKSRTVLASRVGQSANTFERALRRAKAAGDARADFILSSTFDEGRNR
jgi:hypothetical protein